MKKEPNYTNSMLYEYPFFASKYRLVTVHILLKEAMVFIKDTRTMRTTRLEYPLDEYDISYLKALRVAIRCKSEKRYKTLKNRRLAFIESEADYCKAVFTYLQSRPMPTSLFSDNFQN